VALEDEFGDVIRKARTGLALELNDIASRTGIAERDLRSMEVYTRRPTEDEATALATALNLRASALIALANDAIDVLDGPWTAGDLTVHRVTTHYPSHCYVVVAPSGACAIIDPGDDAIVDEVSTYATSARRRPVAILITHGHHDHDGGVAALQHRLAVPVYVHEADTVNLSDLPTSVLHLHGHSGATFSVQDLNWRALPTPGHTAGSTTWVFPSGSNGAAFCGDTMFAGSAGNGRAGYSRHLDSLRNGISALPPATVLYPGHGPATSVAAELRHNPFLLD
jgi:glyoxylase-like metal-dependent hydrolase (beta-lactamase superfamily II)